jgi:hypothetical protein
MKATITIFSKTSSTHNLFFAILIPATHSMALPDSKCCATYPE